MAKLLKGMFLKEIVDQVKKKRGNPGLKKLEKSYGEPLHFSSFKDYPVEKHLKLLEIGSEILFGKEKKKAYFEMGKLSLQTFAQSMIGRTVMALYANDVRKAALAVNKLWGTITNFGIRKGEDFGEKRMKIIIKEDPRPPEYIAGVLAAAVELFESIPQIETQVLGPEDYEFVISWEEQA